LTPRGEFSALKSPSQEDSNDGQSGQALHSGLRLAQGEVLGTDCLYEMRDSEGSYTGNFASENIVLGPENAHFGTLSI